jgi:hypothetical protein
MSQAGAPTAAVRATGGGPVPEAARTREDPVFAVAPDVPSAPAPTPAHAATASNQVIAATAGPPTVASPAPEPASRTATIQEAAAAPDEPAPPTVVIPALSPEPATEAPAARELHEIRYAGSNVPGMAGKRHAAEDTVPAEDPASAEDYWDTEEAGQLAGLVYPAREDHADAGDPEDDGSAPDQASPEAGDDAPPFATAPFAAAPRLNRVRSTPTPPADEDE